MFEQVRDMIVKQLKVAPEAVTPDARLLEDLKADSANVMMLIMDLESELGIMVEDDALMRLRTVGDIVTYIEEHQ